MSALGQKQTYALQQAMSALHRIATTSCCGQADAYWADGVEIKDGQVIAIVTDTRPDIPLGRPHIPVGTRIVVPPHTLKWDRGNPTGHTIIFLSYPARDVLCYVTGTGI